MTETNDSEAMRTLKKLALPMAIGGLVGFVTAFTVLEYGEGIGDTGLTASAEIAVLIGALYLMMGLFVGGGTLVPGAGVKFLNVEDADELREQRKMLLLSSYAMALWGAALIVLALSGPEAPIPPGTALAVCLVLYAGGTYFAFRSYAHSDELMMAVNRDAATWSYSLLLVLLGGWAAIAHAGYVSAPAPIDIISAFYCLVLVSTFIAAARRGMLTPK